MKQFSDYTVEITKRKRIEDFIRKWHYTHNMNGVKSTYCFRIIYNNRLIGAAVYGTPAMRNIWKRYVEKEEDLIELRRLCCIDETPKNTESYFISKTIKWLTNKTNIKRVIAYSDKTYGHEGIIYKAANFKYLGKTSKGRVIRYNGKIYHDKTIRTRYKGELKPFARKIKNALKTGEAKYEDTEGKYIYIYNLNRRKWGRRPKNYKQITLK